MDQPARPVRQRQDRLLSAIFGTAIILATVLLAGLIYQGQGPLVVEIPFLVPTLSGVAGLAASGVAYLVLGRYRVLRDPPAFWTALCFSALSVLYVFYLLTWPGARANGEGIIARLPNTSAWFALLQTGALGVLLFLAAVAPWPVASGWGSSRWTKLVGAWFFLWLVASVSIVALEERLAGVNVQSIYVRRLLFSALLLLEALGAVIAARRYIRTGARLFAYIALAALWALGSGIASLMYAAPYDIWWYLFRLLALAPILVMLYGVLAEYVGLFKRERERSDELRRQKALLEAVLAQMPAGVLIAEAPSGRILVDNPQIAAILGRRAGPAADGAGHSAWRGHHPDGRPYAPEEWPLHRALWQGQAVHDEEIHIPHDDGAWVVASVTAAPIRDARGSVIAAVAIHRDVTADKRDERALRESEARLRDVLLNSRDVLYRLDLATRAYEYVSPAIEALTGYAVEGVLRAGPGDATRVIHPDDRALYHAYIGALLEGRAEGAQDLEFRLRTKSGAYRWFSIRGQFVRDAEGRPVAHVGSLRDTTERQEAELEQRRLAEQRQLALDAARMGWWRYDPQTQLTVYDARFAQIMGIPGGQCPLRDIFQCLHPEDASRFEAIVQSSLDSTAPEHYVSEFRARQDDGSLRWIEAHGSPILEGEGTTRRVAGLAGTIADITERKRAEEALRAANAELTRFNSAMVGRELRMLALKKEINDLSIRLGEPPPYALDEDHP